MAGIKQVLAMHTRLDTKPTPKLLLYIAHIKASGQA